MAAVGLSQKALADVIGGDQPTVQRWLVDGGSLPAGKYLVQLPGALKVSGHWLLTGKGPMAPPTAGETAVFERGVGEGRRDAARRMAQTLAELVARESAEDVDVVAALEGLAVEVAGSRGGEKRPPPPSAPPAKPRRRRPA